MSFQPQPVGADPFTGEMPAIVETRIARLAADRLQAMLGLDADQDHQFIAAAIRNTGAGFQLINDAGHAPIGVTSVETTNDRITLNLGFSAAKVNAAIAVPDETFAKAGYVFGTSVGASSIVVQASQPDGLADYVYYDTATSSWKSLNGLISGFAFNTSTGYLDMTHAAVEPAGGSFTSRSLTRRGVLDGLTATTTRVAWVDNAGATIKAPAADLRGWVTRVGALQLDPTKLTAPGSNIWVLGLMEL